jgi:predicted 3-demethylubiquinone-9 3-methyltransferase (glyoxalase superfamily)
MPSIIRQKITPCLWFNGQVEEAVDFYLSIFKNSRLEKVTHYSEEAAQEAGKPVGSVLTMAFRLEGQEFLALNGGPEFTFSPAISLIVNCETQEEIDDFWERLSDGGEKIQCGWLKDRFGVSWQIVPVILPELLLDKDAKKSRRVLAALMQMDRIVIEKLQKAYEGK